MELKKNPNADLNKKSPMFLNLGLAISLALVLMAFEYDFGDGGKIADLGDIDDTFEDLMEIPPTEQPPPPPPPKIQVPQIIEVPNEEEIEEEIEIEIDVEIDEEAEIEEVVYEEPEEEEVEEIFTIVEEQPGPSGGMGAFYSFVGKEMKYPRTAQRMGIEGKVFVQFVVDKDGSLTDVKAVKGIGGGCDEEAVRVIKNSPKWKPGKQRGRPVKVKMILPITFKLR